MTSPFYNLILDDDLILDEEEIIKYIKTSNLISPICYDLCNFADTEYFDIVTQPVFRLVNENNVFLKTLKMIIINNIELYLFNIECLYFYLNSKKVNNSYGKLQYKDEFVTIRDLSYKIDWKAEKYPILKIIYDDEFTADESEFNFYRFIIQNDYVLCSIMKNDILEFFINELKNGKSLHILFIDCIYSETQLVYIKKINIPNDWITIKIPVAPDVPLHDIKDNFINAYIQPTIGKKIEGISNAMEYWRNK
jgi:hypothetical protein